MDFEPHWVKFRAVGQNDRRMREAGRTPPRRVGQGSGPIGMTNSAYRLRRNIGTLFFSLLVVLGQGYPCAGQEDSTAHPKTIVKPYVDADAYAIYAILLAIDKHTFFVIQSETESRPTATPENVGIKGDRDFYKVWGPVLKDYAKKYRSPRLLTRKIPIEVPCELVPQQQISALFRSETKWNAWGPFYELYPSSGGYFWFSAVGFDPQKTHAIVSMNHRCGMLCGGGGPNFFEKKNGKWREVSVKAQVMHWAS